MRSRFAPLLLFVLVAAGLLHACGGGGSGGGTPACTCPGGECVAGVCRMPDGGVPQTSSGAGASTTLVSCEQPVVPSTPGASGSVVYHQVVTVGADVAIDVPASTGSLTFVQQAVSAPGAITIRSGGSTFTVDNVAIPVAIRDPTGTLFYSDLQMPPTDGSNDNLFFASDSPGTGSITIPNTTKALSLFGTGGVAPGRWTFTVGDWSYECTQPGFLGPNDTCTPASKSSQYDVTVVLKAGANPAGGTLDVRFYVNPLGTPKLDAAAPSPALTRMVGTYASLVGKLTGATVTTEIRNYPAAAQEPFSGAIDADLSGPCSDISQLLRFSEPNANTVNLFLVSDIKATDPTDPNGTTTVVGVDGSIPGPATVSGTVQSGAVVSLIDFAEDLRLCGAAPDFSGRCGADDTAYVAAHETGHFLGLYHTTESTGDEFDPIADSPTCACTACKSPRATDACLATSPSASAPHLMMATECMGTGPCGGGDNLMFWLYQPPLTTSPTLSGDQVRVMLASPAFH